MRASRLLLNASGLSLILAAMPALAQEAPQDSAKADETGETIIVTARRQNERLQDVPASVSVLTASALQNTGAVKAEDFTQLTPGVTIVTGTAEAGDTQINIRGINGARDAESSVALVVDGKIAEGLGRRVQNVTSWVVKLQSGYLYHYAFAMLIGIAALLTWAITAGGLI